MQIHLLAPSTIVFGAKFLFDQKIKIDAKYVCFHITDFVKIVCIMRHQENEIGSAMTMSLVSIPLAKGGPQSKTHLAQEQVNIWICPTKMP